MKISSEKMKKSTTERANKEIIQQDKMLGRCWCWCCCAAMCLASKMIRTYKYLTEQLAQYNCKHEGQLYPNATAQNCDFVFFAAAIQDDALCLTRRSRNGDSISTVIKPLNQRFKKNVSMVSAIRGVCVCMCVRWGEQRVRMRSSENGISSSKIIHLWLYFACFYAYAKKFDSTKMLILKGAAPLVFKPSNCL